MSGNGGKGGSTTESQSIDPKLAAGGAHILSSAFESASQPYRPNKGTTIAAFTPQQAAAFQAANDAASAFGMATADDPMGTMPDAEVSASGVRGYSSGAQYDENIKRSMSKKDLARQAKILQGYGKKARDITNMPSQQAGGGGGK